MKTQQHFGTGVEAMTYALLFVIVMWLAHWADYLFPEMQFYKFGVKPQDLEGLKGIFFMPFIHSKRELEHILNNSLPIFVLLSALIYYYRSIALKVFLLSWFFAGFGLWVIGQTSFSYHIGMSAIIYALAAFLFASGVLRKYRPLQGISLFVAFVYGSMIWGIFPMETHVSWEGHLSGLITGVILAFIYRKQGPQAPKYQYEIEKELGIEPPDLEGEWNERVRRYEEEQLRRQQEQITINYEYRPNQKLGDENDQK